MIKFCLGVQLTPNVLSLRGSYLFELGFYCRSTLLGS